MSIQRYFAAGEWHRDANEEGPYVLHDDHLAALAAKEADYMAAVKQRDEAWSTIEDMRAEVAKLTAQRDEARATKDMHRARQQEEIERASKAEADRDRLRAEVERLTKERDAAKESTKADLACARREAAYYRNQSAQGWRAPDEVKAELERLRAEVEAYKKAKAENDERFMVERDQARTDLAACQARAERMARWLEVKAQHTADCAVWRPPMFCASAPCTCGLAEAIAAGAGS